MRHVLYFVVTLLLVVIYSNLPSTSVVSPAAASPSLFTLPFSCSVVAFFGVVTTSLAALPVVWETKLAVAG